MLAIERARELIEAANRRGAELRHAPSMAHPLVYKAALEVFRGDAAAALIAAEAAAALMREYGMPFWRVYAELYAGWARGRLYDPGAGAAELKKALAAKADQAQGLREDSMRRCWRSSRQRSSALRARSRASTRLWLSLNKASAVFVWLFCIAYEAIFC